MASYYYINKNKPNQGSPSKRPGFLINLSNKGYGVTLFIVFYY